MSQVPGRLPMPWIATALVTISVSTNDVPSALSSQTAEGSLYEVDMQLRPSGTKGPVAVSFAAFEDYYAGEAETWEHLAMTRARDGLWLGTAGPARKAAPLS